MRSHSLENCYNRDEGGKSLLLTFDFMNHLADWLGHPSYAKGMLASWFVQGIQKIGSLKASIASTSSSVLVLTRLLGAVPTFRARCAYSKSIIQRPRRGNVNES